MKIDDRVMKEVLGQTTCPCLEANEYWITPRGLVRYCTSNMEVGDSVEWISIHSLSHLIKETIFENGYILSLAKNSHGWRAVCCVNHGSTSYGAKMFDQMFETEFEACQETLKWVLDETRN